VECGVAGYEMPADQSAVRQAPPLSPVAPSLSQAVHIAIHTPHTSYSTCSSYELKHTAKLVATTHSRGPLNLHL
jgi:hypothetical protein